MSTGKSEGSCFSHSPCRSCCKVESVVSLDERGQILLPKDLRRKANLRAGDKLAVISWDKDGEICCLTLIKADALAAQVSDFLGPLVKGTLAGRDDL